MSTSNRKLLCRTTNTNKRLKTSEMKTINRARTSELRVRKPFEDIWKKKVNSKMNDLLFEVNNEFKKSVENKKEIKILYNRMQGEN
jgi:hypothetical protein